MEILIEEAGKNKNKTALEELKIQIKNFNQKQNVVDYNQNLINTMKEPIKATDDENEQVLVPQDLITYLDEFHVRKINEF